MTTDTGSLRVEARALVAFGVARYEDAIVYSALRRYLGDVGAVPAGAWGTLPGVSDQLRQDWATALGSRITEAGITHPLHLGADDGLLQVATDYEATDLEVALRADLLHSAANTYAELNAEMRAETRRLGLYWQGAGATAFSQYADVASSYLDELHQQAVWLAEEGKKAASLLEGLRNAYAAAGFERIGILIEAFNEYLNEVAGLFGACGNPEKVFVEAVDSFIEYLSAAEQRHVQALAELIKIDEQVRRERPDLGSRGHDTVPFPRPEVGATAWMDRSGWRAAAGRPTQ